MPDPRTLLSRFDLRAGVFEGKTPVERRLADLRGLFADEAAYATALAAGDPLLYRVTSAEAFNGAGDLHYGLGVLMPGKVGEEYFFTKGHFHAWRPAAEVYVGLSGTGAMLLETENTDDGTLVPLTASAAVYVPGSTAHRTVNTGKDPLVYLGIYPASAGHDYESIAQSNFRHVVVERDGAPALVRRADYLRTRAVLKP